MQTIAAAHGRGILQHAQKEFPYTCKKARSPRHTPFRHNFNRNALNP